VKITKKELVRIIEQEVNKVRFPKGPIDQKRLVPDFPKDIPSSDVATSVVELYRSVDALSTSIMQMSARIDGIQKVIKELSGDVKRNHKGLKHVLARPYYTQIDPDDPLFEALQGQIETLFEMLTAMLEALPEDVEAQMNASLSDNPEEGEYPLSFPTSMKDD